MSADPIIVAVDEDVLDLIPHYIERRWADIETIERALEEGDFETARGLGHSMKGSGGSYGLEAVTQIGRGIEEAARAADVATARQWIAKLRDFLERIQVVPE